MSFFLKTLLLIFPLWKHVSHSLPARDVCLGSGLRVLLGLTFQFWTWDHLLPLGLRMILHACGCMKLFKTLGDQTLLCFSLDELIKFPLTYDLSRVSLLGFPKKNKCCLCHQELIKSLSKRLGKTAINKGSHIKPENWLFTEECWETKAKWW